MTTLLPSFMLAVLLIELTPGPNMAYLSLVSAIEGRRAGLAATAGIALGLTLIGLAAVFGLTALLNTSPLAFQLLRWAGVLYLLWLAWEAWSGASEVSPGRAVQPQTALRHFRRGLITNCLNPKAGLFFVAVLPGFVAPGHNVMMQAIGLTGVYVAIATVIHLILVALAQRAHDWLSHSTRQLIARRIFGVLLLLVAVWVFFSTASGPASA